MPPTNAERALAALEVDVLVAAAPPTVTWLTGFYDDHLYGPNLFAAPALAVVRDGQTTLVASGDQESLARETGCRVETYEGFSLGEVEPYAGQLDALRRLGLRGRIAVEPDVLSARLGAALGGELVDARATLWRLRAVKTADEVEKIRAAVHLADAGQAACRAELRPGLREIDLWADVLGAIERTAGRRVPTFADLVSGPRTAQIGGYPGTRTIEHGDVVLCDLSPRLCGWYADSCSTLVTGDPPAQLHDAHRRAEDTLEQLLAMLRPGLPIAELDAAGRARLDYPHHTGHGIGTAPHEAPRIVPGAAGAFEAGMVVALEPATYPGPWGTRVERIALVTENGCEVLSAHSLALSP